MTNSVVPMLSEPRNRAMIGKYTTTPVRDVPGACYIVINRNLIGELC